MAGEKNIDRTQSANAESGRRAPVKQPRTLAVLAQLVPVRAEVRVQPRRGAPRDGHRLRDARRDALPVLVHGPREIRAKESGRC